MAAFFTRLRYPDDARLTFREVINDIMQDMLDVNFKMYKTYTEDQNFAETIRDWMYAKYSQQQGSEMRKES